MAAPRTTLMSLVVVTMLIESAMAATYTVGGPNGGWDSTTDLQTWASSRSFLVGDNLNFQYSPNHDVVEVPKADYDSCRASNSIQSYRGGSTTIPLSSSGKRYFICGTIRHCSQGMKLEVNTLATSAAPTASPINPSPLESPLVPTPSPATPSLAPQTSIPSPAEPVPQSAPTLSPTLPSGLPISPASNPTDHIPSAEAPSSISQTGSKAQPSASSPNYKGGLPISPASNPTDHIPSAEVPSSISRTGSKAQPSASSPNYKGGLPISLTVGFSVVIMFLLSH